MSELNKITLQNAITEFEITANALTDVRKNFTEEIEKGLESPAETSLKMLPSFLTLPTGDESGTYLALDFGGTNVRVLKIKIWKRGNYKILKKTESPLKTAGKFDFTAATATGEELFDFIAKLIELTLEGSTDEIYLGHTFSFPSEQLDLANAKLISWTKEFKTKGVEGENVTELLTKALKKRNLDFVKPVAVINDTVATLISSAYIRENILIGSIYATGHNTCYFEPNYNGKEMIINLESGGFSKLEQNSYDKLLDEKSEKPGEQLLEKMVSGRYVGELYSLVLQKALNSEKLFDFSSLDLCNIAQNIDAAKIIEEKAEYAPKDGETALFVKLAANILTRSASLVAATFLGIYSHTKKLPAVAIDGSLYAKNPFLQDIIADNLKEADIKTFKADEGSALGAAIAAALAVK
ncbi:MAG: hexokinase [Selenomonadaceae bacterium]|nr:hexokinase [Selenomonadaceae bacterium]